MEESERRKHATLLLVRKLLGIDTDPLAEPTCYRQLGEGCAMYRLLHRVAPASFADVEEFTSTTAPKSNNWVVRKGNLITLIRHMNQYAHATLGAPSSFNMVAMVNINSIAHWSSEAGPSNPPTRIGLVGNESISEGEKNLMELTEIFVVMVVLSGVPDIMQSVKTLPRPEQVVLSNLAKGAIQKHALKPLRRYETPTSMVSGTRQTSTHRSTAFSAKRTNSPSFSSSTNPLVTDDGYYRNTNIQLRREMDAMKARLSEMDAKYEMVQEEKQRWENKYKHLLNEEGSRRPQAQEEAHLLQMNLQKEETIRNLTAKVEEQDTKLSAFREAAQMHESMLLNMKRKLKQVEESFVTKSKELREAMEKLSVAEDKLQTQMAARVKLETELDAAHKEVEELKLTQRSRNDGDNPHLGGSFASCGSIDRVTQLESELDDAWHQRDALKKQVLTMEREMAMIKALASDSAAESEKLKVQVQQFLQESEVVHKQPVAILATKELERSTPKATEEVAGDTGRDLSTNRNTVEVPDGELGSSHSDSKQSASSQRVIAVLSSYAMQTSYHLFLQQQQRVMLSKESITTTAAAPSLDSGQNVKRSTPRSYGGSLLTCQRREIERGLLCTVLQHNRTGRSM